MLGRAEDWSVGLTLFGQHSQVKHGVKAVLGWFESFLSWEFSLVWFSSHLLSKTYGLWRGKSVQKFFLWASAHSFFSYSQPAYSLSSMVTLMIFTAGALLLLGSRGGMDMSTSSPSTT